MNLRLPSKRVNINNRTFDAFYSIDNESGIYFYQLDFVDCKSFETISFRYDGENWYCNNIPTAKMIPDQLIQDLMLTMSTENEILKQTLCLN